MCGCVYLYPCYFTCVSVASELMRGADLTASVLEHTNYLLNMLSELGNEASFSMPERAILQLSLSAQMESDFHRLFARSQALNSLASNVPKASENLATDLAKLNPAHEVHKCHYRYFSDMDSFCQSWWCFH